MLNSRTPHGLSSTRWLIRPTGSPRLEAAAHLVPELRPDRAEDGEQSERRHSWCSRSGSGTSTYTSE